MLIRVDFIDKAFKPLNLESEEFRESPYTDILLVRSILSTFEAVKLGDIILRRKRSLIRNELKVLDY